MINRLLELIGEFADGKSTVFAINAGIPKGTFSGYLTGRIPHAEHLVRIRERYSVSIDWILTGKGSKYIQENFNAVIPLDPDPEIAELIAGARRVLTSGNHAAFDALERNIRYFDIAVTAEKRVDEMEKEMKEGFKSLKEEISRLKRENSRLDMEKEEQSSKKKVA